MSPEHQTGDQLVVSLPAPAGQANWLLPVPGPPLPSTNWFPVPAASAPIVCFPPPAGQPRGPSVPTPTGRLPVRPSLPPPGQLVVLSLPRPSRTNWLGCNLPSRPCPGAPCPAARPTGRMGPVPTTLPRLPRPTGPSGVPTGVNPAPSPPRKFLRPLPPRPTGRLACLPARPPDPPTIFPLRPPVAAERTEGKGRRKQGENFSRAPFPGSTNWSRSLPGHRTDGTAPRARSPGLHHSPWDP